MRRTLALILVLSCLMSSLPFAAYAQSDLTAEEISLLTAAPEEMQAVYAESPDEMEEIVEASAEPASETETLVEEAEVPVAAAVETELPAEEGETSELTLEETQAQTAEAEFTPEPSVQPPVETEEVSEPTAQPSIEPEIISEATVQPFVDSEITPEPSIEPTIEASIQPEITPEPTIELSAEPAAEPTVPADGNVFDVRDGICYGYTGPGGHLVIPDGVTQIADSAFQADQKISAVTLPDSVEIICSSAFYECKSLKNLILGAGIREIDTSAFSGSGLVTLEIPGVVKEISHYSFNGCYDLESVILHDGVEIIHHRAFAHCYALNSIILPGSISEIDEYAFTNSNNMVAKVSEGSHALEYCVENGIPHEVNGELVLFDIRDGVLYSYYGGNGDIVIPEGVVEIADYAFEVDIMSKAVITSVSFPSTLKRIGDRAFYKCEISALSFPEGLEEIGDEAFYNCGNIQSLSFPDSLRSIGSSAFENCYALSSLDLGDGPESIGSRAFYFNDLSSLTLPSGVRSVDALAFYCKREGGLIEITLEEGVVSIGESALRSYELGEGERTIRLPASLETIAADAFDYTKNTRIYLPAGSAAQQYCESRDYKYYLSGSNDEAEAFVIENGVLVRYIGSAESVVIPEGVTEIADKAFMYNPFIVSVRFPESVKTIGQSAFQGCTKLKDVVLPSKLETIGAYAFKNCPAITHMEFPGSLTYTGSKTFENCTGLESVVVQEGVVSLSESFYFCTNLKSVSLPGSLEVINGSFRGCTSLEAISIPASVKRIGHLSFENCTSLRSIVLPESVEDLGDSIFKNCTSLRSVTLLCKPDVLSYNLFMGCTALTGFVIPNSVVYIYSDCFNGCTSLKDIYVPASVKEIGKRVFANCPNLTVRGAKGSVIEKYCKANSISFTSSNVNPTILSLPEGDLTLGVGQSYPLKVQVDTEAAMGSVSFKSSSSRVAVDVSGMLTAKKTGSATITVTAPNGLKATCKVTVKAAPKSVKLSEEEIFLSVGESCQLSAELPKNTAASLTYEGGNFFVISVTEDGFVEAVGAGTAEVSVTTHNGMRDSCTITVYDEPESVILDRSSITLRQTTFDQLIPSVNEGSICHSYSFASSDPAIVTVDGEGRLEAVGRGTAVITVSAHNGVSAQCTVEVIAPPPRLELAQSEITLGLKDSIALEPLYIFEEAAYTGAYSYSSKSSKLASVDANGVVTAKKVGSTIVTVSTEDGLTAACKITVVKAPGSIKLDTEHIDLGLGETRALNWTLPKKTAASVSFASSDEGIVTVAPDGTLTAIAPGTVSVTATTFNGKKDTCTVTVHTEPTSIGIGVLPGVARERLTLGEGMEGQLLAIFNEGEKGKVSFSSSHPEYLSVDPVTGEFKAIREYFSHYDPLIVAVQSYNGLTAQAKVEIQMAPPKGDLFFREDKLTMGVGDQYTLSTNYSDNFSVPAISYKSSSTSRVQVDAVTGEITAKKAGSATITATLYNGVKATCKVTVKKAPKSMTLNASELLLGYGEDFYFEPSFSPSGSSALVTYSVIDPDGESFSLDSESGWFRPYRDSGSAVVTASTQSGLSAECLVHFGNAPSSIFFPQNSITVPVGAEIPLDVQVRGGVCNSISYTISNEKLAKADSSSRLIAKKTGKLRIQAETYNYRTATLDVTIVSAPSKYTLNLPKEMELGSVLKISDYLTSTPAVDPALLIKSVSVSSKRAEVVESPYGFYLVAADTGSFTVTVKTWTGKSLKASIRVVDPSPVLHPEYCYPADTVATQESYYGTWKLHSVSAAGGLLSYPTELFGLKNWTVYVNPYSSNITMDNDYRRAELAMDGSSLIFKTERGDFVFTLHTNGWMSLPLYEDMTLWFTQ